MGAKVLFAINLVAFPENLDREILQEILRGGAEKIAEAGAVVVGGHSVKDREPKYGLAVTGLIDPAAIKRKGGARPGDRLLLTKPLGVGVITTALKREIADPADVAAAVTSMKILNKGAAEAAQAADAHAMTDITGFGLLGHAFEMARAGQVRLQFDFAQLPFLPGAERYGRAGAFPGGMNSNQEYYRPFIQFGERVTPFWQEMLWTPETSGGLLVALAAEQVPVFLAHQPGAVDVGGVADGPPGIDVN